MKKLRIISCISIIPLSSALFASQEEHDITQHIFSPRAVCEITDLSTVELLKYQFHCKLVDACRNYVVVVNRLTTSENRLAPLPVETDDLLITALRTVALQFQDMRLRHDLLTGFTFKRFDVQKNVEDSLLQNMFNNIQAKLQNIADSEEALAIHGWEIFINHSPRTLVQELKNDLETIAALNGEFSALLQEVITKIIDPILV